MIDCSFSLSAHRHTNLEIYVARLYLWSKARTVIGVTAPRFVLVILVALLCGQPALGQNAQATSSNDFSAQGTPLDTTGLKPLPGHLSDEDLFGDKNSVWNGVLDKALIGAGVGAIVMALVLAFIFARKAGRAARRWIQSKEISQARIIRSVLILGGVLVLYGIMSNFRYTYLPLNERRGYIQVDNWFGDKRVCRASTSGVYCSDWE
jgi:hypothetical protein